MEDLMLWRKYEQAEESLFKRRNRGMAETEAKKEEGKITPEEFSRITEEIETNYRKSLNSLDKVYVEERNRVLEKAQ